MKLTHRILLTTFTAALALPIAAFAAKGDRKKAAEPLPAFATIDKDGNGSITEAEFVAAVKEKQGEQAAKTQFATLDKDHDGKLTKEELAAATPEKKKRKKKDAN